MRLIFFVILFLSVVKLQAQLTPFVLIHGQVTSKEYTGEKPGNIVLATIHLITDNGDDMITLSDTNGFYRFAFRKISFKTATITIETSNRTHKAGAKCSYYLASRDYGVITIPKDSAKHFIKDFALSPVEDACVPYIPSIKFKHQSLILDTVFTSPYFYKGDSLLEFPANALYQIKKLMDHNPIIIIELCANVSFNEKIPKELSELRAEKVKLELVRLGVEQERIVARGFGISQPLVSQKIINKAKTSEEKELLHSKNRRCTIKILSWDYGKTPEQLEKEREKYKDEEN